MLSLVALMKGLEVLRCASASLHYLFRRESQQRSVGERLFQSSQTVV